MNAVGSARAAFRWHRPLMTVAALMVVSVVVALVGLVVDPRQITGMPLWDKPLKFSISFILYAVTWAWLIAQLPAGRRITRVAKVSGTIIAVAILVEHVLIVGAAAAGTTSHFNVSTPLATAVWGAMAISIMVLYLATLVTSVSLFFWRLPDASLTLAVRLGAVIGLVGLGLAFLMTGPTSAQLADFRGIAGAHTVGLADGGPGLPVLGWSTVGGDLRIPHFIGMHALQLLPLIALLLVVAGRRFGVLAAERVRVRLVWIIASAYLAVVGLVTVQALAGESIVHPSVGTLMAGGAITVMSLVAAAIVVLGRRTSRTTLATTG